jgi:hypothetical protein
MFCTLVLWKSDLPLTLVTEGRTWKSDLPLTLVTEGRTWKSDLPLTLVTEGRTKILLTLVTGSMLRTLVQGRKSDS